MLVGLALAALFVFFNGFFVAAEFALVKLRATQIEQIARQGSSRARATVEICKRLDRYLSATQLGITLASLGLGSVAEPSVAASLHRFAERMGLTGSMGSNISHAVAFTILTGAHILFGELLPKLISIASAEKVALNVAQPLRFFYVIALPGLVILNGMASVLLRALGFRSMHDAEGALSEEEILGVLGQAYARGKLSDAKRLLLERVMRFSDRTARQVMVPRMDVQFIEVDTAVEVAVRRAREMGFTRYPLVESNNLDKVVGYLNLKDLALRDPPPVSLRDVMREMIVVPESVDLLALMHTMQRKQTPIAVVVDEYGGTSGILALEDILEEIVGEIRDEHDEESARVEQRPDGSLFADGLASRGELSAAGVSFADDIGGDTVNGLVLEKLGRLARPGDDFDLGGFRIRVEGVRRRRVGRVRIEKLSAVTTKEN